MAAMSEASIARAKSVVSEATAMAQPAEATTSTAIAQATEVSIATAQASTVVAVRGGEFGFLSKQEPKCGYQHV